MAIKPVSVTQLNNYIKRILSTDPILINIAVRGEVSNLTKHSSGHWYFSLKDSGSRINCFLSSDRASQLRYEICEGMEITVFGSVSLYERSGYCSVNVKSLQAEGEGALKAAFEKLKDKLSSEGLFDVSKKKKLPVFPRKIGVVTSPTGAAVRDIVTTVKRRNPLTDILIYPCSVQGDGSAASVCRGIDFFNRFHPETDLLIVGRGGGSAEDLWTFNEESVARAIAASNIPVISAVGHETDFMISDLAADLRAPTPTAAAELAVPHIQNLKDRIDACSPPMLFSILTGRITNSAFMADSLMQQAKVSVNSILTYKENSLAALGREIRALNPMEALLKGYAAVTRDEKPVCFAKDLKPSDSIKLNFSDGIVFCRVEDTRLSDFENHKRSNYE